MRQLIHSLVFALAAVAALIPACARAGDPRGDPVAVFHEPGGVYMPIYRIEPPIDVLDELMSPSPTEQGMRWGRSVARAQTMLALVKDPAKMDARYDFANFAILVEADVGMAARNPGMWLRDGMAMMMPPVLTSLGRRAGEEVILVDAPASLVSEDSDGGPDIRSWRNYFPGFDKAAQAAAEPEPRPSHFDAMDADGQRQWVEMFKAGARAGLQRGKADVVEWRLLLERDCEGMRRYKDLLGRGVVTLPRVAELPSTVMRAHEGPPVALRMDGEPADELGEPLVYRSLQMGAQGK